MEDLCQRMMISKRIQENFKEHDRALARNESQSRKKVHAYR